MQNALLYNISKNLTDKLQLIQNNAARLIARKKKYDSIEPIRKELHWLPIEFRIIFKINLLTFKCVNGLAPQYLCDLVEPFIPARRLRSADSHLLRERATRTRYGDRSFAAASPFLWNKLPLKLRIVSNLNSFKRDLKTHLFKHAFNL